MSLSDLENRLPEALERAARELAAPPSEAARSRVLQRAHAQQRRRHIGLAVAGTALVVLGIGGALTLRDDGGDQVTAGPRTDPDPSRWADWEPPVGDDVLPSVVVQGLEPSEVDESSGRFDGSQAPAGPEPSFQVFRRPGDYAGPTIYVESGADLGVSPSRAETVEVAGRPATLSRNNPDVPALGWELDDGRAVYIRSWGLSDDELLSFAGGLRARPEGGFEATVLPQELVEDPMDVTETTEHAIRELWYETPTGQVEIAVDRNDEAQFEGYVQDRLDAADEVEQLVVLGRPAVLIHRRDADSWTLQWRHTTAARVEVEVEGGDRAMVDEVIADLREVDEATWQDLLARHGD